jgi:uracil phosphoribosyltransferase
MFLEHHYGPHVHLSDSVWLQSLLVRIGSPETPVHEVPRLVRAAYRYLLATILAREFPVIRSQRATRMAATEPRAMYSGRLLSPATPLVVCAVIRGGILAAETCFEEAGHVLPPENVRLDFLNMSRTTDAEGRVTGVRFDGSKIGGSIDDTVVLIPDPMGATGGTVARVIEVYRETVGGTPLAFVAAHMMVTPEAVQRLTEAYPELRIYAGRFDRGLSPPAVLKTAPGTHKDQERGLTDTQYIVPGAGGIGELLTNAWV